jgi:hypothetical protein
MLSPVCPQKRTSDRRFYEYTTGMSPQLSLSGVKRTRYAQAEFFSV